MRVSVGDCRLFVDVEGLGLVPDGPTMRQRPTVLVLHGGPGFDHSSFKPDFGALSDVAQLVYVDHRGQGRSDRSEPEHWTFDQWADDLVALCDTLEIVDPVVYGLSFGGMVAMHYAIRHPTHPGKVILDSTSAHPDLANMLPVFERLGGPEVREIARRFWESGGSDAMAEYLTTCMPLYSRHRRPDAAEAQARSMETANMDLFLHWAAGEQLSWDHRHDLDRIERPVLLLSGRDDPVTPVPCAELIAAAIGPELCTLETFDDCGHGVWRDRPDQAFDAMRRFIG